MARSASPVRVERKNQVTAIMHSTATTAAMIFSGAMLTPRMVGESRTGSGIWDGTPAKISVTPPRIRIPRPIVTMSRLIRGRATRGRTTQRLNVTAKATMPAIPRPTAAPRDRPSTCAPVATSRAPSTTHSPRAKLIMREALYTRTKASATRA